MTAPQHLASAVKRRLRCHQGTNPCCSFTSWIAIARSDDAIEPVTPVPNVTLVRLDGHARRHAGRNGGSSQPHAAAGQDTRLRRFRRGGIPAASPAERFAGSIG
jgi:hypothetical protein